MTLPARKICNNLKITIKDSRLHRATHSSLIEKRTSKKKKRREERKEVQDREGETRHRASASAESSPAGTGTKNGNNSRKPEIVPVEGLARRHSQRKIERALAPKERGACFLQRGEGEGGRGVKSERGTERAMVRRRVATTLRRRWTESRAESQVQRHPKRILIASVLAC